MMGRTTTRSKVDIKGKKMEVNLSAASDRQTLGITLSCKRTKDQNCRGSLLIDREDWLARLSLEVLCHILSFLPLSQLLKLDSLNRRLHEAVTLHLQLSTSLNFIEDQIWGWMPSKLNDANLSCLLRRCREVRLIHNFHSRHISKRRQRGVTSLSVPGVVAAFTSCKNLCGVEISDIFLLEAILLQLPKIHILKSFHNRNGRFPVPHNNRITLTHNPRITCLYLEGVSIPSLPRMEYMKELYLKWVQFSSAQPFREFSVPMLQTFVMRHCAGPANDLRYVPLVTGLAAARFLTRLELVRVPFLGGLIQHVIEDSWRVAGFRQLQKVTFSLCRDAIESDLGYILIACSQRIEEVYIQPSLTKDSLFSALNLAQVSFPHFETLYLGYVDSFPEPGYWSSAELAAHGLSDVVSTPALITDVGMHAVGQVFPLVQKLTIYNCPHLHLPVDWLLPNGGSLGWRHLKDLHLWRCHAVRLHDFCKLIPLLPSLESLILEQMFREPPKGCSRVGLSAGTGLGVSSALVSNIGQDAAGVNQDIINNNNDMADQNIAEGPVAQDVQDNVGHGPHNNDLEDEVLDLSSEMEALHADSDGESQDHVSAENITVRDNEEDAANRSLAFNSPGKDEETPENNSDDSELKSTGVEGTSKGSISMELEGCHDDVPDLAADSVDFIPREALELLEEIDFNEPVSSCHADLNKAPTKKTVCTCTCGLEESALSTLKSPEKQSDLTDSHNSEKKTEFIDTHSSTLCESDQPSCSSGHTNKSKGENNVPVLSTSVVMSESQISKGISDSLDTGKSSHHVNRDVDMVSDTSDVNSVKHCESIAHRTRSSHRKSLVLQTSRSVESISEKSSGTGVTSRHGKGKSLHGKKKGLVKKSKSGAHSADQKTQNRSCQAVSEEIRKCTRKTSAADSEEMDVDKEDKESCGQKPEQTDQDTTMQQPLWSAASKSDFKKTRDQATSTSDPVVEEDFLQVLSVISGSLVSLTLRITGITDLVIQECPKLQSLTGSGCRVLKNIVIKKAPRLGRVSFAQCRKLRHSDLVDEVCRQPGDKNRLIFLRPMQNYDAVAMEKLLCQTGEYDYHVCLLHDHSPDPSQTLHNRTCVASWLELFTNLNYDLLKYSNFKEAVRVYTAQKTFPWGRQLYHLQGFNCNGTLWDLMTDLPWLRDLHQCASQEDIKAGVYCPQSAGHVMTTDCMEMLQETVVEARQTGMRLYTHAALVYVNMCDLNADPVSDSYI